MNIWSYVNKHNRSMSHKKRKQMRRKVIKKLQTIQPRLLEAKMLNYSHNNKVFTYEKRLLDTLELLNHHPV